MPEPSNLFNPQDAMPGYGMPPDGGSVFPAPGMEFPGGGMSPDDLKRIQDEERKKQAKEFSKQYAQQLGATAEQALQEIRNRPSSGSPLDIKVKADPTGVSSLGGQLSIPISQRIKFSAGGAYAPGKSTTGDIMGTPTSIQAPGQFAASARYSSPFINVDLEYSPKRTDPFGNPMGGGFSGMGSVQGRW